MTSQWQIPDVYLEIVLGLVRHNHPLFDAMRKLQESDSGQSPQTFEIHRDIFLWRQYGYCIVYERMREEKLLILSSLQKM
ncbi:MAG: hypothetical protein R3C14_50570 [Caldilineaceae bacterium]